MKGLTVLNIFDSNITINRPLLFLTLAFLLGILTSGILNPGLFWFFLSACIILLTTFAGLKAGWRSTGGLILSLAFLLGVLAGGTAWKSIDYTLLNYCNHFVVIEGTVDKAPEFRQERIDYVIDVDRAAIGSSVLISPGKVLVGVDGKENPYGYGDRVRVSGMLRKPKPPGNPGEFNYQQYLARRGIVSSINAKPGDVEKLGESTVGFTGFALMLRNKLMQVTRDTLSPVHAAMLNGMMFGSRGEIPRDLQEAFSESGLAHLLCVSGLHVGLVFGGLLFVLRLFGVAAAWVPFAATPVLFLYAAMTGFGPAVLRATVMALLLLWAHSLGREKDWPTTLAAAALVILAVNPLQIYEVGFQLSFAATWGILYLGPWLQERLKPIALPASVKAVLWVSIAAQLATLPLIINNFNVLSFVSILANLVAVPLAGIILFMGFSAGFCGLIIPIAAAAVNAGTSILLGVYEWLVIFVRDIPGAYRYMAPWPWWGFLLWYTGLVAAVEWNKFKPIFLLIKGRYKYAAVAVVISLTVLLLQPWSSSSRLEVHFIDVGQGDSILVRLPGGKDVLVDAGGWRGDFDGSPGVGDYVVVPYLKRLGINQLDALILSHFHEDHAGGARAVLKYMDVKKLIIPPLDPESASDVNVNAIITEARQDEIAVYYAVCGDKLRFDEEIDISLWGPRETLFAGTRSDANNNSMVVLLDYKETEVLLTGDIEEEMQSWLVQQGNLVPVEVLKVPHHGSRFSLPEFFMQVKPMMAVICVGEGNSFNFPSSHITDQLKALGTRVYRTDYHGAVIVKTDGYKIEVETGR